MADDADWPKKKYANEQERKVSVLLLLATVCSYNRITYEYNRDKLNSNVYLLVVVHLYYNHMAPHELFGSRLHSKNFNCSFVQMCMLAGSILL